MSIRRAALRLVSVRTCSATRFGTTVSQMGYGVLLLGAFTVPQLSLNLISTCKLRVGAHELQLDHNLILNFDPQLPPPLSCSAPSFRIIGESWICWHFKEIEVMTEIPVIKHGTFRHRIHHIKLARLRSKFHSLK